MHSIRRLSLRPVQEVSRRLSDALLGPYDALPSSADRSPGSGPSSLPRKLSLALLAPLLNSSSSSSNADGSSSATQRADRLSPTAETCRSPLLGPPAPGAVDDTDRPRFSPDPFGSPRRSPSPSSEKPIGPLDDDADDSGTHGGAGARGSPEKDRRKSSARHQQTAAALKRRRTYLIGLLVLALALVGLAASYLARPRSTTAEPADPSAADGTASTADDNSWLAWRPAGLSPNSTWLSWASSSSSSSSTSSLSSSDAPPDAGTAGGPEAFVEQNLYRRFPHPAFVDVSPAAGRHDAFAAVDILNDACLESWIGQGVPCTRDVIQAEKPPKMELDVVFTWVNGSDPRWEVQHDEFLNQTKVSPLAPPARHYRSSKDELRHSVRSVMAQISPPPKRVHLVLGDWEDTSATAGARRGQVPGWLDWNNEASSAAAAADGRLAPLTDASGASPTEVRAHFHSELFLSPLSASAADQAAYLRNATPNFNSFAIESQLHNIGRDGADGQGAHELANHVAYFNDDFFLLQKHTTADFASPVYGTTLRIGNPAAYTIPYWEEPAVGCEHEWSSLLRSNWLLSRRFGFRNRGYLQHVAKTLSRPLMLEMHALWGNHFSSAAQRRFRETATGRFGDLNPSWLSSFLLVERAREAMLWVWAVGRLGGPSGTWGPEERDEVRALLGFAPLAPNTTTAAAAGTPLFAPPSTVQVKRVHRGTIFGDTRHAAFEELGVEGPASTAYRWSSLDGYHSSAISCEIDVVECFGDWWSGKEETTDAATMFAKLAFTNSGKCGDCLLTAVVSKSGGYGLSALLPANDTAYVIPSHAVLAQPAGAPSDLQPHMPLTAEWTQTSFGLADVLAGSRPSDSAAPVDLRKWALRLIARYQYVDASTNALFAMVTGPTNFGQLVERLTADDKLVSLGMNDDIEEQWAPVLEPLVKTFLDTRFAVRGWWERLVI